MKNYKMVYLLKNGDPQVYIAKSLDSVLEAVEYCKQEGYAIIGINSNEPDTVSPAPELISILLNDLNTACDKMLDGFGKAVEFDFLLGKYIAYKDCMIKLCKAYHYDLIHPHEGGTTHYSVKERT